MVKLKGKAAPVTVPQSREHAVRAIALIGTLTRDRVRIEAAMNDEIATIKERFSEAAAPIDAELRALTQGVQLWADAHRHELTDGGKTKTARLPSGEIKWRMPPPSVAVRGVEAVLRRLVDSGLDRFIRVKAEVNKEAILAEPAAVRGIDGISIMQAEEIVIEPFEAVLEEVR